MNEEIGNLFDLTGKIAVITGGTGFLGREHTKALVGAGAKVVLLDRQMNDDAEALISELNSQTPKVFFIKFEITDENNVMSAVNKIVGTHGKIDILVNNVGYATNNADKGFHNAVEDYPQDVWKRVIEVNLTGTHNITKSVLKQMIKQKSGNIIFISSLYGNVSPDKRIYGDSGINAPIPYSATKAGLINYARHLATHYAESNIRVNVISPGGVYKGHGEDFTRAYSSKVPMNRMMKKEELRGPVLFLASNASSYITGQNLIVDGGWTAW